MNPEDHIKEAVEWTKSPVPAEVHLATAHALIAIAKTMCTPPMLRLDPAKEPRYPPISPGSIAEVMDVHPQSYPHRPRYEEEYLESVLGWLQKERYITGMAPTPERVMEAINLAGPVSGPGHRISYELREGGVLKGQIYPPKDMAPLPANMESTRAAMYAVAFMHNNAVNIYPVNGRTFVPLDGYKDMMLRSYPSSSPAKPDSPEPVDQPTSHATPTSPPNSRSSEGGLPNVLRTTLASDEGETLWMYLRKTRLGGVTYKVDRIVVVEPKSGD